MEQARSLVAEGSDMVKQAGVERVDESVKEGHPANTMLTEISENGIDMIVVGRRGIRGVERFLMVSVSSSIVSHSVCDVLVVK